MVKKVFFGLLTILVAFTFFLTREVPAKEITLKMVTFLPKDDVNLTAWWAYVEEVNKRANGELVIKFTGGPEAIPSFKQFDAVRSGVVDMVYGCESYYGGAVTGAA